MEVHAHTYPPHKKWTHYFWEFLMLFLAVFCGFLAENFREHQAEHQREKILITEMTEDLYKDSSFLSWCINITIPGHVKLLDSAINLFQQPGNEKDRETYQAFLTATEWNFNFVPTDRTLSQLRSYGHRLIRNSKAADVLSELEINYSVYLKTNDHVHDLQNDIDESAYIFADTVILDHLIITDYPFPNDVSINLNDIPLNARVNKTDPGFQNFISKLKKYNFYLTTTIKGEYLRILKSISSAAGVLKKEYHLE